MKIAICDDMQGMCIYYKKVFEKIDEFEIVGTANDGNSCIEMVRQKKPEVLVLDIQMNYDYEGIDIIEELLEISPDLKIIMMTIHEEEECIFNALALGAKDYVLKSDDDEKIVKKIFDVYEDKVTLDAEIAKSLIKGSEELRSKEKSLLYIINKITKLSRSEIEILRAVYYGKKYSQIAAERFVEEGTIRSQISIILKKLESSSMKMLIKNLKKMNLFEYIDLYIDKN